MTPKELFFTSLAVHVQGGASVQVLSLEEEVGRVVWAPYGWKSGVGGTCRMAGGYHYGGRGAGGGGWVYGELPVPEVCGFIRMICE